MADADDVASMVGTAPRRRQAIDQYAWGRAALHFAGISVEEHEALARRLGGGGAGEVLLLVIAQKCGTDTRRWQQAKDLGIPWQAKRWTSLTGLQRDYNDAVAKAGELRSLGEAAALSSSSTLSLPGDARSSTPPGALHPCKEPKQPGSARRDVPPAPCADPPPAPGPPQTSKEQEPNRSHRRSRKTSKEQEPWPEPDETARQNKIIPRTDSTLKEHHLDMKTFLSTTWSSGRAPGR